MALKVAGSPLVAGECRGLVVRLDLALSFWGGYDAARGIIIDEHHPQCGLSLAHHIVVMPTGRGSSSASSVIAEAARRGTAPAGFVLGERDDIIITGAVVAEELYGVTMPVVVTDGHDELPAGSVATIAVDGTVIVGPEPNG